ncbi:hypothetical protein, partial [Secundilactobacillus silagei]
TETTKGQTPVGPVNVPTGTSVTTGKTTVTNNEPKDGVTLKHQPTDTPSDPAGSTTTTTGETILPDGTRAYSKGQVPDAVSVT